MKQEFTLKRIVSESGMKYLCPLILAAAGILPSPLLAGAFTSSSSSTSAPIYTTPATQVKVGIGTQVPRFALEVNTYGGSLTTDWQRDTTLANFAYRSGSGTGGRSVDFQIDYRGKTMGDGNLVLNESRSGRDFMIVNMLTTGTTANRVVFPNGNIGIGTAAPQAKVHVSAGDILLDNNHFIQSKSSTGIIQNILSLRAANTLYFGGGSGISTMGWDINGGEFDMFMSNTGKLGIGTGITNPASALEVHSQLAESNILDLYYGPTAKKFEFQAADNGAGSRLAIYDGNGALSSVIDTRNYGGKATYFNVGAGNVGIGTSTPSVKLEVAGDTKVSGTLFAGAINTNTWTVAPDYVFEKGYKLASLEQVEAFVKENKHLPEVPSAKEFKEKGMDLAEMNFTLLKKVEELTLHAIRQEKEMKRQAEQIRMLKESW